MNRRFLTYDVYPYDMILQFVSNVVWRHLFNKTADNLERSMENEDECTILPLHCFDDSFDVLCSMYVTLVWISSAFYVHSYLQMRHAPCNTQLQH
jgi:Transport protein particle (TRAPP) component